MRTISIRKISMRTSASMLAGKDPREEKFFREHGG
jgi:hypothetical protein